MLIRSREISINFLRVSDDDTTIPVLLRSTTKTALLTLVPTFAFFLLTLEHKSDPVHWDKSNPPGERETSQRFFSPFRKRSTCAKLPQYMPIASCEIINDHHVPKTYVNTVCVCVQNGQNCSTIDRSPLCVLAKLVLLVLRVESFKALLVDGRAHLN